MILAGDCIEVMGEMEESSVDAIVTDPPYGLGFMGKKWDDLPPGLEFAEQALRVLKPGGHLLAFGGTRTYHRLACAVEDAGFEIRDSLLWLYGSGFPKSLDVSKAIDKANGRRFEDRYALGRHIRERREAAGLSRREVSSAVGSVKKAVHYESQRADEARVPTLADWQILQPLLDLSDEFLPLVEREEAERQKVGEAKGAQALSTGRYGGWGNDLDGDGISSYDLTAPATPEAEQWQGWGTALAPSHEPIVVARKPLAGTVASNVLRFGTGALNIDGSRIAPAPATSLGRWPKNCVLSEQAAEQLDEQVGGSSRFFYCSKASKRERNEGCGQNGHTTVKPINLMRWLVRLVTPPGGTVLDPFTGSGTTGCAAALEGFDFIGIEREAEYVDIAEARIAHWDSTKEPEQMEMAA